MSPEGFEPPTFGSGIQRAAVAPWALKSSHTLQYHTLYYQFHLHRTILNYEQCRAPPELRWQSGRLLTDRSLVRSQVVALKAAVACSRCLVLF